MITELSLDEGGRVGTVTANAEVMAVAESVIHDHREDALVVGKVGRSKAVEAG